MRKARLQFRRHGFTLVELVIVMMLLCILAAITAPIFRGFAAGRELGNTARHLVAVAQWAQTQSITRSEVYRLNFDLSQKTYWLTVRHGAVFEKLGEEIGRDFTIPTGLSMDIDLSAQVEGTYVEFQPTGRCDAVYVRLTAPNGSMAVLGASTAADAFVVLSPDQPYTWGQHPSPIRGAHL